jgi:predicted nucleic acid-binding protein
VPWAILDTNVYIGFWERGLYDDAIASVGRKFVVRYSAVVFSELRRGARTFEARRRIATLAERAPVVWPPLVSDWWEAGRLIQKIGDEQEWERSKRRDFQNDALIALTARRYGATVVTANRLEFELLSHEIGIAVLGV